MSKSTSRLKLSGKEDQRDTRDKAAWEVLWLIPLLFAALMTTRFLLSSISGLVVKGISNL
jgi:hypothetical protein